MPLVINILKEVDLWTIVHGPANPEVVDFLWWLAQEVCTCQFLLSCTSKDLQQLKGFPSLMEAGVLQVLNAWSTSYNWICAEKISLRVDELMVWEAFTDVDEVCAILI